MEDEKIINKILGLSILALYSFIALFVLFTFGLSKVEAEETTLWPYHVVMDSKEWIYDTSSYYEPSATTTFINVPLGNLKGVLTLNLTVQYKVQTKPWFISGSISASNIKYVLMFKSSTTEGNAYFPNVSCYSNGHTSDWVNYICTGSLSYTSSVAESMVLQLQNPEGLFGYYDGYDYSTIRIITDFKFDGDVVPDPEPSEKPDYSEIIDNSNKNNQQLIDSIQNGTLKDNSQPDNSKTNDYKDKEDKLIDKDSLNNINNIEISIDPNAHNFIWNLVNKILATNSLIYGLMITMLSIGIIKLVLNR